MIKTAPHSTLKRMVCTHPDLLARICKLVDRKKFGLICLPRLIYFLGVDIRLHQLDTRFVSLQNHLTFQWELRF